MSSNPTNPTPVSPPAAPGTNAQKWYKNFAGKKMGWVLAALVGVIGLSVLNVFWASGWKVPSDGKGLLVAGLVVAVVGQLVESASKSSEAEANPDFKDGLVLVGEGIKFYASWLRYLVPYFRLTSKNLEGQAGGLARFRF